MVFLQQAAGSPEQAQTRPARAANFAPFFTTSHANTARNAPVQHIRGQEKVEPAGTGSSSAFTTSGFAGFCDWNGVNFHAQASCQPSTQDSSTSQPAVSNTSVSSSPQPIASAASPFLDARFAASRFPPSSAVFVLPPRALPASQSAMKRKAPSESTSVGSSSTVLYPGDPMQARAAKRPSASRSSSVAEESPTATQATSFRNQPPASADTANTTPRAHPTASNAQSTGQSTFASGADGPPGGQPVPLGPRKIAELGSKYSAVLPAGKVFPIQIGSELFRLSGASISSDAPSYFSHFFADQLYNSPAGRSGDVKTLYIDRDPATFRDISLHLQGYHVKPRDGEHFVRLFADSQFYSLPRLTQQLFKSEIFIQIGDRDFQIPRDLFSSPGDSPNFFSLGFAHFFTTPQEVFPGLDRQTLLRPPSILPPAVSNRSGEVFADLLHLLQGYQVHIRDEDHRANLLRDARYFHLKGLEQHLLPCQITFNLVREKSEILVRLEDIRQSGISFGPDSDSISSTNSSSTPTPTGVPLIDNSGPRSGWVKYARPFADASTHELILEISGESSRVDLLAMRATFHGQAKARIASLFQVIASKMGLPATQPLGLMMMQTGGGLAAQSASPANSGISGERVKVAVGADAWVEVDGERVFCDKRDRQTGDMMDPQSSLLPRLRWIKEGQRSMDLDEIQTEWVVSKSHWRLRMQPVPMGGETQVEVVMYAVKIEASTGERARNGQRGFLA